MKYFLSVIFILLLLSLPAFSMDSPDIVTEYFVYDSEDGNFSINIQYPQIEGLEDEVLQEELNDFLQEEFLVGYGDLYGKEVNFLDPLDLQFCEKDLLNNFGPDSTFSIEVEYIIGVNKNGILSVSSQGLGILTPSAHPTKLLKTFTVDLYNGKVYEFEDLFIEGSDYMNRLEGLVEYIEKNGDIYDFYLTEEELFLVNINSPHAIQGISEPVRYEDITDIINDNGPIGILMDM